MEKYDLCLGGIYVGQHCFWTRVCSLNDCQEVHHRPFHQQIETNSSGTSVVMEYLC